MTDLDTAIVGAGPYGLSIAAHLRAARVPYQLFGTPLESWRAYMPEGMILKSERFASNLWDPNRRYSFKRYCAEHSIPYQAVGSPLSLELFLKYADWFREHAVGEFHDVKIVNVRAIGDRFELELADGTRLTSRRVVLATGHMAFRELPPQLAHFPEPYVVHSTRIGPVKSYSGRDVTLIGAGQSSIELAALLHEAGARVRIVARKPALAWNDPPRDRSLLSRMITPDAGVGSGWKSFAISELPRVFRWCFEPAKRHRFVGGSYGPSGAWWLRKRVGDGIEVCARSEVQTARVQGERVLLSLGSPSGVTETVTDQIIAATGFKIDVDRLEYLEQPLRKNIAREINGVPALTSRFETSVPRLFMVGVASAPVFGPIMRFMYGAKHVAPVLTRRLKSSG